LLQSEGREGGGFVVGSDEVVRPFFFFLFLSPSPYPSYFSPLYCPRGREQELKELFLPPFSFFFLLSPPRHRLSSTPFLPSFFFLPDLPPNRGHHLCQEYGRRGGLFFFSFPSPLLHPFQVPSNPF